MGATEIVQVLVSPAEKLIEAVSGAIGKAYEPKHIRKMADAKAYELKLISDTVRNNSDVPIVYDSTGVSIDTSNFEEIAKRASSRLAYQEITKQQNIEAVVDNAYEELENETTVSDEPINPDWMFRFFNSVENISNEDMQKIWGHILAGEIKSPNTYSYRTLEKLKNMTQQEAEHFQLVASLVLHSDRKYFILSDCEILNKYNVNFEHLLELEECGMMSAHELALGLPIPTNQPNFIYNSQVIGIINGKENSCQELEISVHVFTESGKQLINAIHPQENKQYILDCLEWMHKKYKNFVITAHNINFFDDKGINYDKNNILSLGQV